jgi:hypothetical protein
MSRSANTPAYLARRVAARRSRERAEEFGRSETRNEGKGEGTWRRETYRLPRVEAREIARDWFDRYPKAAYLTEVESWRVLDDGRIEFTMRRLPSAD